MNLKIGLIKVISMISYSFFASFSIAKSPGLGSDAT